MNLKKKVTFQARGKGLTVTKTSLLLLLKLSSLVLYLMLRLLYCFRMNILILFFNLLSFPSSELRREPEKNGNLKH